MKGLLFQIKDGLNDVIVAAALDHEADTAAGHIKATLKAVFLKVEKVELHAQKNENIYNIQTELIATLKRLVDNCEKQLENKDALIASLQEPDNGNPNSDEQEAIN